MLRTVNTVILLNSITIQHNCFLCEYIVIIPLINAEFSASIFSSLLHDPSEIILYADLVLSYYWYSVINNG